MRFKDALLSNFRTKEEVQEENNKQVTERAINEASSVYDMIKEQLIDAANKGLYSTVNGEKVVSCIYKLSDDFQIYFSMDIRYIDIPAVPSSFDQILGQMVGKSHREARRIFRQNGGRDASFSNGKPAEHHSHFKFSINSELKVEFDTFLNTLKNYAIEDGIGLEVCIYDETTGDIFPLPIEFKDGNKYKFDYTLSLKCTCEIPKTTAAIFR